MRIRWTEPATRDFLTICDYTREHHGNIRARETALQITEKIESLERFPHVGRIGRKPDTRELVLADLPFLAVYRVRKKAIEVLRILHGAQRWP